MRTLIACLLVTACAVTSTVFAAAYSTDATMALQKDEGTLQVVVRVSQMLEQDGKLTEKLIATPKITTAPGVPATLYTGRQPTDPEYENKDNITVDVSWPYPNESGIAFCAVTIKRGNTIVSKSKLQLKIEGPGRSPLVLRAQDIDPQSVQVKDENSQFWVLLEFAGKTRQEVKKLAVGNYGNKVQIQDQQGRILEGGLSFGTYREIGMAIQCTSESQAKHLASILRREPAR